MSGYQELCICRMAYLCSAERPVFVYPSDELPTFITPIRSLVVCRGMCTARSRNVLRPHRWQRVPDETEVRALMKVLIGVDPHKMSLAVAAVDETKGELLERAGFSHDCSGLRALERWAKRFPERR